MKTRLVHIDVIFVAFENYLQKQLIPVAQIPAEIAEFRRELAKTVVLQNQKEKIPSGFGNEPYLAETGLGKSVREFTNLQFEPSNMEQAESRLHRKEK